MREGRVYTTEGDGPKRYHYEANPANWPARARRYAAERNPITKLAKYAKAQGWLTPDRREVLRHWLEIDRAV
jgi:hypothetical protein